MALDGTGKAEPSQKLGSQGAGERKHAVDTLLLSGTKPEDITLAGELLSQGEIVGIPTETVYGLAADATNPEAVRKIFAAKGRPADNPLIVHIADLSQWAPLVRAIPPEALRLAERFWPGPLTIILEKSDLVPMETSGGLSTVGVRFPAHPAAQAVIRAAGVPLAAPSANRSGRPSPTTFSHLREDMEGRAAALLDGGDCGVGVESTVLSLAGERPRLLRPGGVTLAQLESVLGEVEVDPAVLHRLQEGAVASSPGMKYRHYAPKAEVVLVDASPKKYANYVNQKAEQVPKTYALCFEEDLPYLRCDRLVFGSRYDSAAQAHLLFSSLDRLDQLGARRVYAHMPSKNGIGLAVYNRMIRAAGFQIQRPEKAVIIGLTGPSGAGKSTVGELLREAGWAVIDCDGLTKSPAVYSPDCIRALQEKFGEDVAPGGKLDRKLLAGRALPFPEQKQALEAIVFPRILRALQEKIEEQQKAGHRVIVLDAPTLFEAGLDDQCDRILAVTATWEQRLARVMRRDGLTRQQCEARFQAQHDEEFFRLRADHMIQNEDQAALQAALAPIIKEISDLTC